MKKYLTILAAVMMVFTFAGTGLASEIGDPIPKTEMQELGGKAFSSTSLVGTKDKPAKKELLLIFFNTGCSICRKELTEMKEFAASEKVDVIAAGIDIAGPDRIQSLVDQLALNFKVVYDPDFALGTALGLYTSPAAVLFAKDGTIKKYYVGYSPRKAKEIKKIF